MVNIPLIFVLKNDVRTDENYDHSGFKIKTFFGGTYSVRVDASTYLSSIIFDDDSKEILDEFFLSLEKRIMKTSRDARVVLFGIKNRKLKKTALSKPDFSALDSIDVIYEYMKSLTKIADERFLNGLYLSKKLDVFIVRIEENSELWRAKDSMKKISFIFENLKRVAVRVIFLCEKASYVPSRFVKMLEWQAFVGENNSDIAKKLFPDFNPGFPKPRYSPIGYYHTPKKWYLPCLYAPSKPLNEKALEDIRLRENDKQRYFDFLDSLSDGEED